jgi:hypothetical protein
VKYWKTVLGNGSGAVRAVMELEAAIRTLKSTVADLILKLQS